MGSNPIFIDTSAFKALVDEKDEFHQKALAIWERISEEPAPLLTSNFIIDETLTLLRSKRGLKLAIDFRDEIERGIDGIRILRVTAEDEENGWKWFLNDWRKLSFTDCVSFALMKRLEITRVVTFDEHFKRAGFVPEH